jgi:hypothetical protein
VGEKGASARRQGGFTVCYDMELSTHTKVSPS